MTGTTRARPTLPLRPPRHRVERRAVGWWALQSVVLLVPVAAGLLLAYALFEPARPWLVPAMVAVLVLLPGLAVEPFARYAVHRWETTDEAVYAVSGWLVREWRLAPISRIQTVDTVRGPLERLFGLATLRITTASAQGPIAIGGLDEEVAVRVARQLGEVTQRTPGDAT